MCYDSQRNSHTPTGSTSAGSDTSISSIEVVPVHRNAPPPMGLHGAGQGVLSVEFIVFFKYWFVSECHNSQHNSCTLIGSTSAGAQADSIPPPLAQVAESSVPLEPAPPYTTDLRPTMEPAIVQCAAGHTTIVNNFYFGSSKRIPTPTIQSCFGPALTVGLMSLCMLRSTWVDIWKCAEYKYQEHEWPNILLKCGVPHEHIAYVVGLIHAENAIELI
jgi:hypothetical protein